MESLFSRTSYFCGEESVLHALRQLPPGDFYVTASGSLVSLEHYVRNNPDGFFQVHFRCLGGKGGFGSLLRSFRVNKSTNQDMMRNLDGRRLGAVEKEKKIRTWLEKQAEREKEVEEKRKSRIAKLKSKPVHDYADSAKYEEERREIEDKAETAFEDGLKNFLEAKNKNLATLQSDESDSDSDLPGTSGFDFVKNSRKRKASAEELVGESSSSEEVAEKREKTEDDCCGPENTPHQDEVCAAADTKSSITDFVEDVNPTEDTDFVADVKPTEETAEHMKNADCDNRASGATKVEEPKEFPAVDLDTIGGLEHLETLGLDHLKHALEVRGLKCGGSLHERAARLFSVKGLKTEQYPKNIKAAPKKNKKL